MVGDKVKKVMQTQIEFKSINHELTTLLAGAIASVLAKSCKSI